MIKRLARCIREYKWAALLSPLCMVGEVTMEILIPLVMAKLYDHGITMQNMAVVVRQSVLLIILAVTSLSFGVASADFAARFLSSSATTNDVLSPTPPVECLSTFIPSISLKL